MAYVRGRIGTDLRPELRQNQANARRQRGNGEGQLPLPHELRMAHSAGKCVAADRAIEMIGNSAYHQCFNKTTNDGALKN